MGFLCYNNYPLPFLILRDIGGGELLLRQLVLVVRGREKAREESVRERARRQKTWREEPSKSFGKTR